MCGFQDVVLSFAAYLGLNALSLNFFKLVLHYMAECLFLTLGGSVGSGA